MKRPLLAIDPGRSGAMAECYGDEKAEAKTFSKMTDVDLWYDIESCGNSPHGYVCYIEKVGPMPTDGKASLAKFMLQVGMLRGFLIAADIRFIEVTPATWMRHFNLLKHGINESKTKHKNRIKQFAQERYPDQKVTLATADALVLLEFAKDKEWR